MADVFKLTERKKAIVRLLRRYAACRMTKQQPLPSLTNSALDLDVTSFAIVAYASVFHFAERCLRRPLIAECSGSQELSSDEHAILQLMEGRSVGLFVATPATPCGLLRALGCAIASAKVLSTV